MTGLNKITDKILADAQADAQAIIEAAEQKCREIDAEYAKKAQEIKEKLNADAEREGESIVTRAKSSAAIEKRNLLLETKSNLVDEAFDSALADILALSDDKYCELLVSLLISTLREQVEAEQTSRTLYGEEEALAPERYEVILNRKDRDRLADRLIPAFRAEAAKEGKPDAEVVDKVFLSDSAANIDGGLIVRYGDIESNCSLGIIMNQLRPEIEAKVIDALFGQD